MSWFKEIHTYNSEKNGIIECSRTFGTWSVLVDNYFQSGRFTNKMWKKALRKIPNDLKIKNVLVLGLGGGSVFQYIYKKFGNIHVTTVDWDPVMEKIYREHTINHKYPTPEIIIEDVTSAVKKFDQQFDLIIIDVFNGNKVAPEIFNELFAADVAKLLKTKGALIVNCWYQKNLFKAYDKVLSRHKTWNLWWNNFALYRRFGQGKVGDPLPEGYIQPCSIESYIVKNLPPVGLASDYELVKNTAVGSRWFNGIFTVENYRTIQKPTPEPFWRWRVVVWQPPFLTGKQDGWYRTGVNLGKHQTAVAIRKDGDYTEEWNENVRRQLKKFKKQDQYEIVEGSLEGMCAGLGDKRVISFSRSTKQLYIIVTRAKALAFGDSLKIWLVRNKKTNENVAGLAVIDVPEVKSSIHLFAFHFPEVWTTGGGVGLIDAWYAHTEKVGIKFMDYDLIWRFGDPMDWRGFSKFKLQFNPHIIKYPTGYIRIIPPNK